MTRIASFLAVLGLLILGGVVTGVVFSVLTYTQTRTISATASVTCNTTGGGGGGSSGALAVSALCNDSNVCTVDLLDSTFGTCVNPNAAAGTPCTSLCWDSAPTTNLTCNGRGVCAEASGNISACRGMCQVNSAQADFGTWNFYESISSGRTVGCDVTTIPFKMHYFAPINFTDYTLPSLELNFGYPVCYAQVCNFVFLTITGGYFQWLPPPGRKRAVSDSWYPRVTIHTSFPCEELIDTTFPGFDAACLVTREERFFSFFCFVKIYHARRTLTLRFFLLQVPVDAYFLTNFLSQLVPGKGPDVPIDAFNQTWMGRFCAFHYKCAETNATIYNDPVNNAAMRRSAQSPPAAVRQTGIPENVLHAMLPHMLDDQFKRKKRTNQPDR